MSEAVRATGIPRVLASGGVFMNVKANKLIGELPEVEHFDVFPSCGDESLPFGAAWLNEVERRAETLGCGAEELLPRPGRRRRPGRRPGALRRPRSKCRRSTNPHRTCAELLAAGEIVARCAGRMEFGARALGNRSILANPSDHEVVPLINRMIKNRDFWMPFAPTILAERADDYLVNPKGLASPYMMLAMATRPPGARTIVAAAIHPQDGTARAADRLERGMEPRSTTR